MKALCIISGGMDSTTCAFLAKESGYEIVALHFDYKQRTQEKERACFKAICKELGVKKSYIINADFIAFIGANSLTDTSLNIAKNALNSQVIPNTYVPFRNGIFLSIAASIAEKEECEAIFIGVVQVDNSGYPDCSKKFIKRAQKFINEGKASALKIKIKTPLVKFNKTKIVKLALKKNIPLHLTWSCYESNEIACGECDSCLLRLKGFKKAGIKDKIAYQIL